MLKNIIFIGLIIGFLSERLTKSQKTMTSKKGDISFRTSSYRAEIIASNLMIPWAIALSEDGKIYFTERTGALRLMEEGELYAEPLIKFEFPFISTGEGGLMGLALDPNFSENHYMYVMYTYQEGNQLYNRVVRLIEENNQVFEDEILLDNIPGGQIHNGGRIKIGPDQKLYITTGDAGYPNLSQDIESLAGKILRLELDGSIPIDNPISGSPVYSLGHRNPQGLAWSKQNILYATDHGPQGYDEINLILPGANYGWPLVQGDEDSDLVEIQLPLIHSGTDTWAPSGLAFIDQGPWQGELVAALLRGSRLLRIVLNKGGAQAEQVLPWLENEFGRLREVVLAEDSSIYLTTNNRDGRGTPVRDDDRIIRLVPV